MWPSVWPLDHQVVMAALMAASCLMTPFEKDATSPDCARYS
jgi:hypothetical protein